jgi:hypothetical protein
MRLHRITSRATTIWILTVVKTSNVIKTTYNYFVTEKPKCRWKNNIKIGLR